MEDRARWQLLAWGLAAAVVVFLGARALGQRTAAPDAAPVRVQGGGSSASGPGRSRRDAGIYVHVTGAVHRPGLYRVPAGSRTAAAVQRAGGASRKGDLVTVNLAAKLQDGQQVIVPVRGAAPAPGGAPPAGGSAASAAGATGAKLSLATATVEQLDGLDGIGPTLAKRIVEYRTEHGGFRSVSQLQEVDGIGAKRFAALRDALAP